MSKQVTFTVHYSTLNLIPSLASVTLGFFNKHQNPEFKGCTYLRTMQLLFFLPYL